MPTMIARRPSDSGPPLRAALLAAGLAGLLLSACGQSNEERRTIYADCVTVMSDGELAGELRRASTSPDAACTCVQAQLADHEDDREDVALLLNQVATLMKETGASADDAMGKLIGASMLKESTGDEPSVARALPVFNQVFDETLDAMGKNGGACPAV